MLGAAFSVSAVAQTSQTAPIGSDQPRAPTAAQLECITEPEVVAAQEAWGEGIVKIGNVYSEGGDYRQAAIDHIDEFYAYDESLVLFKPTLASVEQFRPSFDGALSYFVGGNPSYPEDKGFAITPWTSVRWQNAGITNNICNMAVAMGNYYFTPADGGEETKVEYTIGYIRDAAGDLKMAVHKSTIPYSPE
ncbi:phosphoribosyl-AMP cyclohydrolase [Erythrobacter sp. KMU-140]|uniref:Phosphoribosyl-AMP cyclohydrolase n=1 Tax=Erythrobacter rubeus TaxID=2760803 RepID=A0ABR8KN09_9SPHN|nr:phosphoribosyl-AMP cyclohydrolase [Erythrobacter rubeus]